MQGSTILFTTAQTTNNLILVDLPTKQRPESTKTNSSKMSRVTSSLKKTSTKFEQKFEKLKARVSKPKEGRQESEKQQTTQTPEAVDEPRGEEQSSIDLEEKKQGDANKAKRDARRAKWAARRASLKRFAKKAGKAIALSGAVVLGFIFGPILIIIDLAVAVVGLVLRLIMELVGLICAPFYVCFVW